MFDGLTTIVDEHSSAHQPNENTLFEIGSITKVFTTTLLADMHLAGDLNLDDPINKFLPEHGQLTCPGGADVTLRHLATHSSGLPRLPSNLGGEGFNDSNPYVHYSSQDLFAWLRTCRLTSRPGTNTVYSNVGSGLLGELLARIGGTAYERLIAERILAPLGMRDTAISLSPEQRKRLATGHSDGEPVGNWDFQALAGAGALRSSIADMLRFLRANIDPDSTSLRASIELTHQLQTRFHWKWYRDFGCVGPIAAATSGGLLAWHAFGLPLWLRIAIPAVLPAALLQLWRRGIFGSLDNMTLGWHAARFSSPSSDPREWVRWHNGGTAGYSSYLAFSRRHRTGVVLLANSNHEPDATGREILSELLAAKK